MNPAIDNLLSQVYELEGLLLVIERHKGDVSPFIYEMIQKKAVRIGELAPLCMPELKKEVTEEYVTDTAVVDVAQEPEPEVVEEDFAEESVEESVENEEEETNVLEEEFDTVINEIEEREETIKLDEALQRTLSKDLSRAFSLNDRFRYRRELFSNSEVEMRNALNIVEAMQSYAEAEDYFYGDLEWDSESPEVMDFMAIIKNHFL